MIPRRLDVVTLGARDLPRLRAFYEALGWHATSIGDTWCRFDTGGATLALFGLEALAKEAAMPVQRTSGFKGLTLAACVQERQDVDAAMAAVEAAGGRVLARAVDREWGGRSGYFADPEGNAWEIAWLPGASFAGGAMRWPDADAAGQG